VGIWTAPLKPRTILKLVAVLFALFAAVLFALWAFVSFDMTPPAEKTLIENFQTHRSTFEQLRDMMIADHQLKEVHTASGVTTISSGAPRKPWEARFPINRYNEYVELLQQVGSTLAFKSERNTDQLELICVGAWGAGWAGDTRHIWYCWASRAPENQISSLDDYYRNPKRKKNVFRHIEADWYLSADW
jgi:hypothetical protein